MLFAELFKRRSLSNQAGWLCILLLQSQLHWCCVRAIALPRLHMRVSLSCFHSLSVFYSSQRVLPPVSHAVMEDSASFPVDTNPSAIAMSRSVVLTVKSIKPAIQLTASEVLV